MARSLGLSQLARRVEALDHGLAFLRDRLGLREICAFPGLAFLDLGGTRLLLRETGRREEADLIYFAVDDIHAAHRALASKGVIVLQPPHLIHRHADGAEEWLAFFEDDEARPPAIHVIRRVTGSFTA